MSNSIGNTLTPVFINEYGQAQPCSRQIPDPSTSGVSKLVAGANVLLTPTSGTGEVIVSALGGAGSGAIFYDWDKFDNDKYGNQFELSTTEFTVEYTCVLLPGIGASLQNVTINGHRLGGKSSSDGTNKILGPCWQDTTGGQQSSAYFVNSGDVLKTSTGTTKIILIPIKNSESSSSGSGSGAIYISDKLTATKVLFSDMTRSEALNEFGIKVLTWKEYTVQNDCRLCIRGLNWATNDGNMSVFIKEISSETCVHTVAGAQIGSNGNSIFTGEFKKGVKVFVGSSVSRNVSTSGIVFTEYKLGTGSSGGGGQSGGGEVGTKWEFAESDESGVWTPPAAGTYQIEMSGGHGGPTSTYASLTGGAGRKITFVANVTDLTPHVVSVGKSKTLDDQTSSQTVDPEGSGNYVRTNTGATGGKSTIFGVEAQGGTGGAYSYSTYGGGTSSSTNGSTPTPGYSTTGIASGVSIVGDVASATSDVGFVKITRLT